MFSGALTKPLFWIIIVVGVLADQATKMWAVHGLGDNTNVELIGSLLTLTLVRNPGAAFSIGIGNAWVFALVAVAVIFLILIYARRIDVGAWYVTLAFVVAGAIGNLVDRVTQPPGFLRGHVIDFINYNGWFVGNVADIYIVVAVAAIVILTFAGVHTRHADRAGATSSSGVVDDTPDSSASAETNRG